MLRAWTWTWAWTGLTQLTALKQHKDIYKAVNKVDRETPHFCLCHYMMKLRTNEKMWFVFIFQGPNYVEISAFLCV